MVNFKEYLGDSVYVDFDGEYVILTTNNGAGATSTIELDVNVLDAFTRYLKDRLPDLIETYKGQAKASDAQY